MESQHPTPPNGRSDAGDAGGRTVGQRIDRAGHSAEQAWTRTREGFDDLREGLDLQGRANRHPYGTVAAALGIGYILGGGLFSPLTARIAGFGLRMGLRLAVLPLLREELAGLVEALGDGDGSEAAEAGRSRRRSTKQT